VQIEGSATRGTLIDGATTAWYCRYAVSPVGYAPEGAIRFRATCAQIEVNTWRYFNSNQPDNNLTNNVTYYMSSGGYLRLTIDGVDQPTNVALKPAATSAFDWVTVATGLDDSMEHEYLVSWGCWHYGVLGSTSCNGMGVKQLRLTGGTGLNTNNLAARPLMAFLGDSIATGQSVMFNTNQTGDATQNWTHQVALACGFQVANRGIPGYGMISGAAYSGVQRIGDITTLSPAPSIVFVEQGVNDAGGGLEPYLTQFKVGYQTYLYWTRKALPKALIICSIPTYRNDLYDVNIPAYCQAVSDVVAAFHDPLMVVDWTMNLTYDPRPGNLWIHPDAAACLTISAKLAPQVYNCAMSHGLIPLYMPYATTAAQLAQAYWYEPGTSTDPYVLALQQAIWTDPGSSSLTGAYAAIQKCVFYPPGTPGLGLTLDQQQLQLALWSAPGTSTNPVVQGYQQILRELP
jgi:GDSL-like Lipase/Acylhydrolase family